MNKFRLKIIGLVVLILAAIIGVYFCWPGESPRSAQLQEQNGIALKPQPDDMEPKANADPAPARGVLRGTSEFEKRKAAQLRQTADLLITLYRNPTSPEAVKARESLVKLPEGLEKPGIAAGKDARSRFLNRARLPRPEDSNISPLRRQSQGPHASTIMTTIEASANPGAGNLQQLPRTVLKEHLRQYKATRNEMFPTYRGNLPVGLLHRLPVQYRMQMLRTTSQRPSSYSGGFRSTGAGPLSASSPRSYRGQSSPGGMTIPTKSFKRFKPTGVKTLPKSTVNTAKPPALPEPENTTNRKTNTSR